MIGYNGPRELTRRPGDAGFDLYAGPSMGDKVIIAPGDIAKVNTEMRVIIPEGYGGFIWERSGYPYRGTTIAIRGGVIDHGYTGEIILLIQNTGNYGVKLDTSKALAQLVIMPIYNGGTARLLPSAFSEAAAYRLGSWRGERGFGSTDGEEQDAKN